MVLNFGYESFRPLSLSDVFFAMCRLAARGPGVPSLALNMEMSHREDTGRSKLYKQTNAEIEEYRLVMQPRKMSLRNMVQIYCQASRDSLVMQAKKGVLEEYWMGFSSGIT